MRALVLLGVVLVLGCSRSELSPDDAGLDGGADGGPPQCSVGRTFLDCGCGCCGGTTPSRQCVYSSQGQDFDALVRAAQDALANTDCSTVGCSQGVEWVCCD